MNRRAILKYTALATGAAVSGPLMMSILSGCTSEKKVQSPDYQAQFFQTDEFSLLQQIVDVILPKTDSPAASEVGVPKIIDEMVGSVYPKEDRENYRAGFTALSQYLNGLQDGKNFGVLSEAEQLKGLQALESSTGEDLQEVRNAYLQLKQQTVAYYLSTETIATKYLNYLPVPGAYEACIPLTEVDGKAWAL